MPDIVISEFMDAAAVGELTARFDVHYDATLVERRDELTGLLAEARALIVRNRTAVSDELLRAGPRLLAVGRLGVGLDNIDVDACRRRGIEVLVPAGANAVSVAEYVLTGALMLVRGAFRSSAAVAEGAWPRERLVGRELAGKTLGLVGFGAIAREVARRAACLGLNVTACDPNVSKDDPAWRECGATRDELGAVLAGADVVSVHVPLTPQTANLLDDAALGRMRPTAVLINTSRGGVVDEQALARRLRDGRLGGAMLDVFASEPLLAGSALAGVPNLVLTPHIAGLTEESNARVGALTAASVARVLERDAT